MKLTKNGAACQHCGKSKATNRIIWRDDDGEFWSEDWCDDCTGYADDYECIGPIEPRYRLVDGVFLEIH